LESTNYNYSCTPITSSKHYKIIIYIIPELRTINSILKIPSHSTFCTTVKTIRNIELNSTGIKSFSEICDVKVGDLLEKITNRSYINFLNK
jgi:hypothetical protein